MATKKSKPDPTEPIERVWRGRTVWQCPQCDRDSENRSVIEEHIAEAHTVKPHPLGAVTEAQADGTAAADENDGDGAVSDGGGDGHRDR